jgi:hypothetical protein
MRLILLRINFRLNTLKDVVYVPLQMRICAEYPMLIMHEIYVK